MENVCLLRRKYLTGNEDANLKFNIIYYFNKCTLQSEKWENIKSHNVIIFSMMVLYIISVI